MARLALVTTLYALCAAVLLAAPLSASQEPEPQVAEDPAAQEPVTPEPAAEPAAPEEPAEPAPAPAPAPAEPAPAQPAPAEPAPAEPTAPEPQVVRDKQRKSKPRAQAAASTTVTISDFQFAPGGITINVGDTVTWSNSGPTPHSATANDGSFDTGIFPEGESRSHTFNQAGTFNYICTPHPQMKGTVTVQGASTGGGDGSGSESQGDTDSGTAGSASGDGTDGDDGAALPATGRDSGGLFALGVLTLALGVYLRRRTAAATG
jgi:LPXTG-motif cell wall-anchored protein